MSVFIIVFKNIFIVKGILAKNNAPVPSFLKIANQKYSPTKVRRRIANKSFMLPPIPSEENDTQTEARSHLNDQDKENGKQELSFLYPGKRYLYSNNSSNNDVYFTENVLNSPSPKDEYPPLPSSSTLSEPEKYVEITNINVNPLRHNQRFQQRKTASSKSLPESPSLPVIMQVIRSLSEAGEITHLKST